MSRITTILTLTLTLFGTAALGAWEGVPTANATAGGLKFLGCANEIDGRALTGLSFSAENMTVESCGAFCAANRFWMSGVEAGRECFCGKFLAPPATYREAAACDMPCTGDKKQMCGGWGRVSIYNNTAYNGPSAPGTAKNYDFKSCYMEPMWNHALPTQVAADDQMTVDKCMDACGAAGFQYCGLEYGRECWGGNALDDKSLSEANDPTCAMQCDMPCGGNPAQMCGGRATVAVYQKKGTKKRGIVEEVEEELEAARDNIEMKIRAMKGRFVRVRRPAAKKVGAAVEREVEV